MSPTRKKSIPFVALFGGRNESEQKAARDRAQQAYDNPRTPPELRAELGRYLADPFHAAAVDTEKMLAQADERELAAQRERDEAEKAATELRKVHRSGRKVGTPNKKTPRIEAQFDKLYSDNPDCTVGDIIIKYPRSVGKMGRATVARHWKNAKERAGK